MAVVTFSRFGLWCATVHLILSLSCVHAASLRIDHIAFRVSYVQDSEKVQRASLVADAELLAKDEVALDSILAHPSDSIVATIKCSDADGNPAEPVQSVLRFADESTQPPRDTIWPMTTRRNELRREVSMPQEIRADNEFWRPDTPYTVEIIVGDQRLEKSVVWTITRSWTFNSSDDFAKLMKKSGVFDFDLRVKKTLLPEFETPLPPKIKEAPLPIVVLFTALSVVPLFVLLVVWSRMGAFSFRLPKKTMQIFHAVMFQLCLVSHAVVLGLFWVRWNLVTTLKVIGVLMIPTLLFGHSALGEVATIQYFNERSSSKKDQ